MTAGHCGNLATVAGFRFMLLVIFSYEPNIKIYLKENYFFPNNNFMKNILQRKTFYILHRNKRNNYVEDEKTKSVYHRLRFFII
jgi:hypothetical protein